MSDVGAVTGAAHWVSPHEGVTLLIPAAGAFAWSPDETWLAWVEGPHERTVVITEWATRRTVTTLRGSQVSHLDWTAPDTLRVLRRKGADAALHTHAIPDGGELARIALPAVGAWPLTLDHAAGRTLLGRAHGMRIPLPSQRPSQWILRDEGPPTPLDLAALDASLVRAPGVQVCSALRPDGAMIAVALGVARDESPSAAVAFLDVDTGAARTVALPTRGEAAMLAWVSPARALVATVDALGRTALHTVTVDGEVSLVATLPSNHTLRHDRVDVNPERTRALIHTVRKRFLTGAEVRCFAEALRTDGRADARTPDFELSRQVGHGATSLPLLRGGGACWSARGELITFTHTAPGEARIVARSAPDGAPHTRLHMALPGVDAHELSLEASPRRAHAVAAWFTHDAAPSSRVRRLAVIALQGARVSDG